MQDQLCNYCQDYTVATGPAANVLTLYRPGEGYPGPVALALAPQRAQPVYPARQ